jgi:hypothetical protein
VPAPAHIDGVAALHHTLRSRALAPAPTPEAREYAIAELLDLAGGRPEPLEAVRDEMQDRLARHRDDVEALDALRLVEGALLHTMRSEPWAFTRRERRSRRRWET